MQSLDVCNLLGYCNTRLNSRRKANIRGTLNQDCRAICDSTVESTKFLLGDDMGKLVKDAKEVQKMANTAGRGCLKGSSYGGKAHSSSYTSSSRGKFDNTKHSNNSPFLGRGYSSFRGKRKPNYRKW